MNYQIKEAKLDAKGIKFGIIVSRFNSIITKRLLDGAMDALIRHKADIVFIICTQAVIYIIIYSFIRQWLHFSGRLFFKKVPLLFKYQFVSYKGKPPTK